jgi:hypothetical protein
MRAGKQTQVLGWQQQKRALMEQEAMMQKGHGKNCVSGCGGRFACCLGVLRTAPLLNPYFLNRKPYVLHAASASLTATYCGDGVIVCVMV